MNNEQPFGEPKWIKHNGSRTCPVPKGHDVEIMWGDGTTERRIEHGSPMVWGDWPNAPHMCITHYRDWTAFEAMPTPQLIPFGGGVIMIGSVVRAECSAIVIRGCRDGYQQDSGKTPEEAWDASRGAPEWWLTFLDPNDAIMLADKLFTLAYNMNAAREESE